MLEYVCPVEESMYEEVLDHLRRTFFWEEPLNVCVSLCEAPGAGHPKLEAVCRDTLEDGLSVAALSEGKVVATALNGSQTREQLVQAVHDTDKETDEKFKSIFSLLYRTNLELALHNKYSVDKIFECRILSVDPEFRGRGIAKVLLERSEQHARKQGFRLFKEDATSAYSQRVACGLGLIEEIEIMYADHLGEDGKPLFEPPPPHASLKVMSKILE